MFSHYRTSFQILALETNCSEKFVIEKHRVKIKGVIQHCIFLKYEGVEFIGDD